jgi:hypothetical protein
MCAAVTCAIVKLTCGVCCGALQVHKLIDGFKSRREKPDVGKN